MRTVLLCTAFGAAALLQPAHSQVVAKPDPVGDTLSVVVPLLAAGYSLYEKDTPGLRELGYTLLVSQGTTEVLKRVVDAPRPDGTGRGFPSGHASIVFASSAFVHERYGLRQAVPLYALSVWTAYSRVHTEHHFTRDVVGGAVIGVGSAFLMTHPVAGGQASVGVGAHSAEVHYSTAW